MALKGQVVAGQKKAGEAYGLPTANMPLTDASPLPFGVYIGQAFVRGQAFSALVAIGPREHQEHGLVEVHLFGWSGDLYGSELEIEIGEKISDWEPYQGEEAMKAKIAKDVEKAKRILSL